MTELYQKYGKYVIAFLVGFAIANAVAFFFGNGALMLGLLVLIAWIVWNDYITKLP